MKGFGDFGVYGLWEFGVWNVGLRLDGQLEEDALPLQSPEVLMHVRQEQLDDLGS